MRRIIGLTAVVFLALGCASALASPMGGLAYNLMTPGVSISSGVGFMQRDVHRIKDERIVDESSSSRFMVKLDIAPVKYFDVYGLVGAADYQIDDVDYRGNLATAYGGGVKQMLFPFGFDSRLNVLADVRYLAYTTEDHNIEARFQEFQGALTIAYLLRGVAPYGGLKYNPIHVGITGDRNDLEGEMNAGVFIGCEYFVTPNVFFTGEISIFSETSIHLMVGYNYPPSL